MFRQRAVPIIVAASLLLAGACGSDGDTGSTTSETPGVADSSGPPGTGSTTGRDRSAELLGRWEVVNYLLPEGGGLTNVVGDEAVFIEFNSDGTVRYSTGCNSGGTEYGTSGTYYVPESALDSTPEGQSLTMGPQFEQTERGCDGFLGDQDRDLPINLGAVTRFTLDGERLLLLDEFLLIETFRTE